MYEVGSVSADLNKPAAGPVAGGDGSRRRGILLAGLVVASYLLLACLVYWPYAPWSSHRMIDCVCSDPVQEVWFLRWTAWAAVHGHNPFFSYYLNAPHGANLAINTSFPLLGVIATPVTMTAGPIVSYNLLLRLALASSAAAMYFVLRRYTRWWPAAYAGGLLFGFSPYMIGHAHRHLFLTFLPLLPLFIPLLDDWLVRPRRNAYLCGALVGLLTAAEFLISPEIAVLAVLAGAGALLTLTVLHRHEVAARVRPLLQGLVSGTAVLAVLAGPALYVFLFGRQRPVGALHPLANLDKYHGDLAGPVVPTHGEVLHAGTAANGMVNHSIVENGFYLGVPLLLLVLYGAVRCWRNPLVQVTTVMGVVSFVFALGGSLDVLGHRLLNWMPFDVLTHVPLLENIEPARLSLLVQLPAAIVLAVALDELRAAGLGQAWEGRLPVGRTATVAIVAIIALVPLIPRVPLRTGAVHIPRFFTTDAVRAIPQGTLMLTYPYNISPNNNPMLWQAASDMRFRIFGGDAYVRRADGSSTTHPWPPAPPSIYPLLRGPGRAGPTPPDAVLVRRLQQYLRRYRVGGVLIDPAEPGAARVTRIVSTALGGPPRTSGGMQLWLLPRSGS